MLIVPFRVEAMLTNRTNPGKKQYAQISPDYAVAAGVSYLGGNVDPAPMSRSSEPLPAGCHLHFILPDALTHAVQTDSGFDYQAVPNRWLVTRIIKGNPALTAITVIESDSISKTDNGGVAIPTFDTAKNEMPHVYLGRSYTYGSAAEDIDYLDKLTAVGAGDPLFAAYYPNCRNVFGLYDNMANVPVGSDVAYFVSGYYTKNDPLNIATVGNYSDLLSSFGWSAPQSTVETRCVLFGEVFGITWQGYDGAYPDNIPEGDIKLALGNTSAEALSAVLAEKISADPQNAQITERLLTAMQYEAADRLSEPGGIAAVEDIIHAKTFASEDGGNIWEFRYDNEKPDLPPGADLLLCDLNAKQRSLNSANDNLEYEQDNLYAAWYSYMLAYENEEDTPPVAKAQMQAAIEDMCNNILPAAKSRIADCSADVEAAKTKLFTLLGNSGATITQVNDTAYSVPRELAALLYGSGLQREYAFGEDGAFSEDGTLQCQNAAITSLTYDGGILNKSDILKFCTVSATEPFDGYYDLLCQALCLNPGMTDIIVKALSLSNVKPSGTEISPIAVRQWQQSRITLLAEWALSFFPARDMSKPLDNSMIGWTFDGTDYDNTATDTANFIHYSGRTVLTPHSAYLFRNAAKKYLSEYADENIKKAVENLVNLPALSQSLSGLNSEFLSRYQTLQFPLLGIDDEEEFTDLVRRSLGKYQLSVKPEVPLFPIRAGHFKLDSINLITTFGSVQSAAVPDMTALYSEVLGSTATDKAVFGMFHPRLSAPSRIVFDWLSADGKTASPVYGFLMPELLNGRLSVYSADGEYYGMLKTVYRSGTRHCVWLSRDLQTPFEDTQFADANLKAFVKFLLDDSGTAFAELMALLAEHLDAAELPLIWGRPLALAKCALTLENKGGYPYSQNLKDFGKRVTLGAENVEFPAMLGDMKRANSGLIGYFDGAVFSKIYPAFNSAPQTPGYVRYGETLTLSLAKRVRELTLLTEIGGDVLIQTGILPLATARFAAEYVEAAANIELAFEATALLGALSNAEFPLPKPLTGKQWKRYYQSDGTVYSQYVTAPVDNFADSQSVIADSYFALEK